MIKLRDYQERLIDDIAYEFSNKNKVCAVAPCGAGKTITVGWMAGGTAIKKSENFIFSSQTRVNKSVIRNFYRYEY